ncbi:MAG: hypothetical protein H8E12_17000 [Rhodobacteraceae bacterium]|nr:hypothetical protein [Paracoccaceae bacterium]
MFFKKYKTKLAEENRDKLKRALELIAEHFELDLEDIRTELSQISKELARANMKIDTIAKHSLKES